MINLAGIVVLDDVAVVVLVDPVRIGELHRAPRQVWCLSHADIAEAIHRERHSAARYPERAKDGAQPALQHVVESADRALATALEREERRVRIIAGPVNRAAIHEPVEEAEPLALRDRRPAFDTLPRAFEIDDGFVNESNEGIGEQSTRRLVRRPNVTSQTSPRSRTSSS